MKTLFALLLTLTALPAHAATSVCLVTSDVYNTTVYCDGATVHTYEDTAYTTITKALQSLTAKGYRIVGATAQTWTLEKDQ